MDPVSKAEALAQRALQSSAVEKQAAAEKRVKTWAKIQQEAPQIADILTEISKHTGKPKAVTVELKNEVILNIGEFDKEKRFYDGKIRKLPEDKAWRR